MKILGITNFYSSLDPLCPQAIQKPAEILIKKGCSIEIISPVPYSNSVIELFNNKWKEVSGLPRQREVSGIKVFHPKYLEIPKNILKGSAGLRYYSGIMQSSLLDSEMKYDIIHAHMCYPDGYAAMKLSRKQNIPYIVTVRGTDLITLQNFPSIRKAILKILNNASKVIFPSYRIAREFDKFFSKKNTEVITNAINIEEFEALPICSPCKLNNKVTIVSVANLVENKGIDINLMAIAKLVNTHQNIHYLIVGDGSDRKRLEELVVELKIDIYVTFIGKVDHNKALRYINECDIFSLPSWKETFGLVYLEAMYLKKPIIATFNDGIDGTAIDQVHGLFAHEQNVDEVVEALNKLISSSELRNEMGFRGHQEVLKNYTWDRHAEKVFNVYNNVKNEYRRI